MNRLRELREERGLSTYALATELNKNGLKITFMTVNRYENGEREPKLETWERLAEYFGVTPQYLVGWSNKRKGDK